METLDKKKILKSFHRGGSSSGGQRLIGEKSLSPPLKKEAPSLGSIRPKYRKTRGSGFIKIGRRPPACRPGERLRERKVTLGEKRERTGTY